MNDAVSRFWAKVDTSGECWLWLGSKYRDGYGNVRIEGRTRSAHRVAWDLSAGPVPANLHVLHTCDNPACVRNDDEGWYEVNGILHPRRGHLWLGTNADNTADRVAKDRQAAGARISISKFTADKVSEIRRRWNAGGTSMAGLAREYGCSPASVQSIIHGRTWKHVLLPRTEG